jgi:predicted Zn-dependent peptidase
MFQGSTNLGPEEHPQYIERAGGSLNASVTEDRTNYFQTVPPESLNLALWLEADRMRSLRITEENMRREIEVVKEERHFRFDNAPYGTTQLAAYYEAPYSIASCFAYAHSVIGSPADLDAASLEDVQAFFDAYYAPNNATLTVAGRFDPPTARALIASYFGLIPSTEVPPEVPCENPFAELPLEISIQDPNAVLPAVFVSYGSVNAAHPDAPALDVLGEILGAGQSSRLFQRMVRGDEIALEVAAFSNTRRGPGIFQFLAIANQGVEPERLLAVLDEEIQRLIAASPGIDELERARNRLRAGALLSRQTTMGRAEALQAAQHFYGTPAAVATEIERLEAVTAEDVRRAAETYLRANRRAVLWTRPGAAEEDE